ncbi:MAG TPA: hypothetical protein VGH19_03845 [Verrucomicrobiae bacterium]
MNTNNSFTAVPREELTAEQMAEMLGLLAKHFEGVTAEQFARDLAEKNWVVMICKEGRLVGFSTLLVYETTFEGELVSVVYSGDTIVDPAAWGSSALARGWITAVNELRLHYPRGKYYWLLLSSGFRTYRFLPVFWREFYPHCEQADPQHMMRLRDHLAKERFGERYDEQAGIVRFSQPQRLRQELREVPESRRDDPHVELFLKLNPGHGQGDELVCLTELCAENLTRAGRRMVAPQSREACCDHN